MPVGGTRLDAELVRQGLARSRRRAAELVADGKVRVAGEIARKASQGVDGATEITVVGDQDSYVSRGAHKLIGALDALAAVDCPLVVTGRRCLDAGASTGGFTQVLLERGAGHVVAVDVGHDQLAADLVADPRVTALDGVNARYLRTEDVGGVVDAVVADLSFISLTIVLPSLARLVDQDGWLLPLVKPQFEVGRGRLAATGVVRSPQLREEAVVTVARSVRETARVEAVVPSPLPGPSGNREYFLLLRPVADEDPWDDEAVTAAVRAAVHDGEPVVIRDRSR